MLKKAFVLIQTEMGSAETVAQALKDKPGIASADVVTGPHDIIAVIEGADAESLAKLVINAIQTTKGVKHTTTYMIVSR